MLRTAALLLLTSAIAAAQTGNKPERLEWFRDAGFGLFIHWSVDGPLGSVISHSLAGADFDYRERFFSQLPAHFNPKRFDAGELASLAKLAGMRYMVFTTKHHAGFCMFRTKTTEFNVMKTPFGRDITADLVYAFRRQGIAPGFYFSPDDFLFLHRHNIIVDRRRPEVAPANVPALLRYDQEQIGELLTNYGKIDLMFLDGPPEGLREHAWKLQPDIVVTRGAIETPEQYIPGVPLDQPWEACITMGNEWNYKPTNDHYKTGTELIQMLIETRAKGGNLLLNVGPKPNGELAIEQENLLREIASWMFVNSEAVYAVRPWVITNEGNIWFTKRKDGSAVYAFLTGLPDWKLGDRKQFVLRSVKAAPGAAISVLGHDGKTLEYLADADATPRFRQTPQGLELNVMRAQRMYTNRKWPNPIVVKLTNVQPGLRPPRLTTGTAAWDAARRAIVLRGELREMGQAPAIEMHFQYRPLRGVTDLYERAEAWRDLPAVRRIVPGAVTATVTGVTPGRAYEYRLVAKHPLVTLYGEEKKIEVPGTAVKTPKAKSGASPKR
ncbi:MAG: alpha-L-fucosidase [Acidobacteria bacterium]|nr:alpha-L-fucosidase [Acidobacteriota bacterium]